MKRLLVLAVCVAAAVACDPLLPLRVKSEVQPVHSLDIQSDSNSVRSGFTLDLRINALDGGSNPIDLDGKTVSFTVNDTEVATVVEVSKGLLRVTGKKVGTATITVEIDGVSESKNITVNPGVPSKIELSSGGSQLGVVADPLLLPLVFQVRDLNDNAVPSATITLTTTSGSVPPTATTGSAGQASVSYTPGAVGDQSVTARVGTTAQVVVPVTVTTLQPVLTAAVTDPRSGVVLSPAPVIQLQYASTSQSYPRSGKTVTATITGSTTRSVTAGGTVTTNNSGTATFSALKVTGTAGATVIRFTITGPGTFIDAPVTLRGGLPTSMTIATQPSTSAVTGRVFNQPPVIQLRDADGNDAPESNVSIQAAVSGLTPANALASTDADGKATFGTLTFTGSPGTRTMTFTSPSHTSLSAVQSTSFFLTGVETQLSMNRSTSIFACDAVPTTTPRVQLQDAGGNAVPQSGVTVTAGFVTGTTGATVGAGATAVTDATGLATFSALKLRGAPASHTLDFTAGTLTKVQMSTSLVHGAADSLVIVQQPQATVQNGVAFSPAPTVRVYDDCGNIVTNTSTDVSAAIVSGTATFTNGTATTSSGLATFSNLQMAGVVGPYRLRFTATGAVPDTADANTTLDRGAAARVVLTVQPPDTNRSNVDLTTQPKAIITDVGGNKLAGTRTVNVTLSSTTPANGLQMTGTSATQVAGDSAATFSTLRLTGVMGSYRLVFSSTGLANDTADADVRLRGAGTASKVVLDTAPSTGVFTSTTFIRPPVIRLRDSLNTNVLLPNIPVTVSATGNPFTINNGTNRPTDANGKVSFSTLSLSGSQQSAGTLTFTVPGLPPVSADSTTVIVTPLTNNTPFSISEAAGTSRYYGLAGVPASQATLTVSITGLTGDAEIFVRHGGVANTSGESACQTTLTTTPTTTKTCTVNSPAAGTWFVTVKGTTNYSGTFRAAYP